MEVTHVRKVSWILRFVQNLWRCEKVIARLKDNIWNSNMHVDPEGENAMLGLIQWMMVERVLGNLPYANKSWEEQDRQCTYNNCCCAKATSITYLWVLVCVCVSEWVSSCVCECRCTGAGVCLCACSLTNPQRNASPYCYLRLLWLHHNFRHYLINGIIFGKTLLNTKHVF